jgi:hypothetical protein
MTNHDEGPPWIRAGGYPHADWHKCLKLAIKRWMTAEEAKSAFLSGGEWKVGEFERLDKAAEAAHADERGVIFGDPAIVSRLFGDVLRAEEKGEEPK